ncbi:MAG: RDD family protein [Chloroflexota bacterium]|nr:RDD family protein [Chloroflexota bacterium]
MQQDPNPSDSEQQQKLDWELASYSRRATAWLIDILSLMPLMFILWVALGTTLILGLYIRNGGEWTDISFDMPIIFWIALGLFMTLLVAWWLFTLRNGQTPGKQIAGIRVIKDDGSPSGWGYTFLREFVIKFLLMGFCSVLTLGVVLLVDYLWPLLNRSEKMQTLHDKLLGTLVVRNR